MSYDPTQQVPPPQGYPPSQPPQNYPQQPYPQQPYTQQSYPHPQPPAPQTYPQYGTPPAPGGQSFDFGSFWKSLGTTGQVCLIGGVVLFLSLFFNWYSESINCSGSACTEDVKNLLKIYDRSGNAWAMAAGGISLRIDSASGTQTFSSPLLWLVIIASIVLIILPILGAMGKMAAQQTQLFVLITAGLALLIELVFLITAFTSLSPIKDDINRSNGSGGADATFSMATGPSFGFVLGLLATLAAGGVYFYFSYIKKPAVSAYGLPYQQVAQQYPGSQPPPYQPPTQYPGSQPQPYQPPTQYQQPPQYPGQYPGQPPQYPGQ